MRIAKVTKLQQDIYDLQAAVSGKIDGLGWRILAGETITPVELDGLREEYADSAIKIHDWLATIKDLHSHHRARLGGQN